MAYRQLKAKEVTIVEPVESQLSAEQIAAYLRQSSTAQVLNNVESADMQLTGAQQFAISQGVEADKIMIGHEGGGTRGVSGTLPHVPACRQAGTATILAATFVE